MSIVFGTSCCGGALRATSIICHLSGFFLKRLLNKLLKSTDINMVRNVKTGSPAFALGLMMELVF